MVFLRILQASTLIAVLIGVQQILPLSSEIQVGFEEQNWNLPRLCGRLAAVCGPVLVAGLIAYLLEVTIQNLIQERKLKAAYPQQPWLHKPQWAAKHMRLSNRPLVISLVWFFLLYLFVALPLAVASEKRPLLIIVGVIGLIALLVVRMIWIGRSWNRAELRISTLPGVIGGPFTGAIILHETFSPETVFDVNLKCESARVRRYHKKSEVVRNDLWSSTISLQKPLQGGPPGSTVLPVSFAIPFDAQPTRVEGDETIRWMLSVQKQEEVSTGGANFEVPVYRTADSRADYEFDKQLMRGHLAVIDPAQVLRRFGLKEEPLPGGSLRLHFREFDLSIFMTLIVMGLMLVGVLLGMGHWIVNPNTMFFAMLFPGIFLLMFLYGIIYMLLWRCRIDLNVAEAADQPDTLAELNVPKRQTKTITATSGIWGIRKTIQVPVQKGTVLRCRIDHRANNQESWSVWLHSPDKQSLRLLSTFKSAHQAHSAAEYLGEKLGISVAKIKAEDGFLK